MESPTDIVNKRFKQLRRRPDVPRWFTSWGWIPLMLAFVLFAGVKYFSGETHAAPPAAVEASVPLSGTTILVPTTDTTTVVTSPPDTTPGSSVPDTTIQLASATGGQPVSVPLRAYQVGMAVAKATVDGNTTGILILPSGTAPSASGTVTDGYTATLSVMSASADEVLFSAVIDPDGPGPQAPRYPTIRVQRSGSDWGLAGS